MPSVRVSEHSDLPPDVILTADEDSRVDRYRHLQSQIGESERATFEIVEGLGHAYPADLDRRVAQFLSGF